MASVFRPSTPADAAALEPFLRRALALGEGCPGFDAAGLHWKYWAPGGDWDGPRSYLLEGPQGIEAHCGAFPLWRRHPGGRSRAAHFFDWAAAPGTFGAGVRLLRKVAGAVGALCAVGGSQDTRKILPLLGARPANEVVFLARPVRPFRQALTHPQRDWKLPARLVRNTFWAWAPPLTAPAGWSFEATAPNRVPAELWSPAAAGAAARERSPAGYACYLACPFLRFELFLARRGQQPAGCFLIGFVQGQARVADLWLREPSPEAYEAAYRLALAAALTDPAAVEVIASASVAARLEALRRCGLREYRREPIQVWPADQAPPDGFDCQMAENDTAFLAFEAPVYMT